MKYKVYIEMEDLAKIGATSRERVEREREDVFNSMQRLVFRRMSDLDIISLTVHVEDGDELAIYTAVATDD